MKKRNCEEVHDGFPTNGIKYESNDVNHRHESVTNKELRKKVKRLQDLLKEVRKSEIVFLFFDKITDLNHVFILQTQIERDKMASKMSQLVPKPSCMV